MPGRKGHFVVKVNGLLRAASSESEPAAVADQDLEIPIPVAGSETDQPKEEN